MIFALNPEHYFLCLPQGKAIASVRTDFSQNCHYSSYLHKCAWCWIKCKGCNFARETSIPHWLHTKDAKKKVHTQQRYVCCREQIIYESQEVQLLTLLSRTFMRLLSLELHTQELLRKERGSRSHAVTNVRLSGGRIDALAAHKSHFSHVPRHLDALWSADPFKRRAAKMQVHNSYAFNYIFLDVQDCI